MGYQGWFSALGDNSPTNVWWHGNLEMWPDTREYAKLYSGAVFQQDGQPFEAPLNGNLGNEQPAKMFSSCDQETLNPRFKWMKDYEIDCAALQRFGGEIGVGTLIKTQRDGVASKMRISAENYGVKFYINYDLSDFGDLASIKADWTNTIVAQLNLPSSSAYAKQNGKPVVSIYGLGYAPHPSNAADALDLVNWFKSQGCYVIGSCPG